mgnify:CR=1 FL=1
MKQTPGISEMQISRPGKSNAGSLRTVIANDFKLNKSLYLMILPAIVFYILFSYLPMYGAIIAFKDYSAMKGIWGSEWVGLANFKEFLGGFYFLRIFINTLLISVYSLIFEFPAPIIFALLLNEIKNNTFKKTVQTITYFPYFISLVVICGLIRDFTNSDGIINILFQKMGGDGLAMLQKPGYFRPIYIVSQVWQTIGWSSIIYLSALTSIDHEQYEAAKIDGAGRLRQLWNITLPGILPTIVIMLILRIGNLMNVGFEKIILLYSPATYETADVISSFVYRKGLLEFSWSFSAAVGLFNSVINFILLIFANQFSKKITENSLW